MTHEPRRSRVPRSGAVRIASASQPFELESGASLREAKIDFRTWGTRGGRRTILVCHALTGDADAASSGGWWRSLIDEGGPIDPERDFIICSNVLGGCSGSTGPASLDPESGSSFGTSFPQITIADMVRAQRLLLDGLGVVEPITVVGGSIGAFQAIEWSLRFPERVAEAIVIAGASKLSAFGLAFNALARRAIRADPKFQEGAYHPEDPPVQGLSIARGIGHLTYRTREAFEDKFSRSHDGSEFSVERYLAHKGDRFVRRFDANTYIGLTRAMDAYDAASGYRSLTDAFSRFAGRLFVAGFGSDWLFPPSDTIELAAAARIAGIRTTAHIFESADGHDAFLLPHEGLRRSLASFLGGRSPGPLACDRDLAQEPQQVVRAGRVGTRESCRS